MGEFFFQGFRDTGSDLEAIHKYLDGAGSKLDYRTYGETLFDILIAGGILSKYKFAEILMDYKLFFSLIKHFFFKLM